MDYRHKKVLIRADLNVPLRDGEIENDLRLRAILPTLLPLLEANAAVTLISHLGRPNGYDPRLSLKKVAQWFKTHMRYPTCFLPTWPETSHQTFGHLAIAENLRFLEGEMSCDMALAQRMANTADVFIFDAFATAHRDHASTLGLLKLSPICHAGPLFTKEIKAISSIIQSPKKPVLAIIGGSKIKTKARLITRLLPHIDHLCLGGGLANTALVSEGYALGTSLYDPNECKTYQTIRDLAHEHQVCIHLPKDGVGSHHPEGPPSNHLIQKWPKALSLFDIGAETIKHYCQLIQGAETLLWSGPLGLYEHDAYAKGSKLIAQAIHESKGQSILGGGDTVAVVEKQRLDPQGFSHISTGGGAFLAYFSGLKALSFFPNLREYDAIQTH